MSCIAQTLGVSRSHLSTSLRDGPTARERYQMDDESLLKRIRETELRLSQSHGPTESGPVAIRARQSQACVSRDAQGEVVASQTHRKNQQAAHREGDYAQEQSSMVFGWF